MPCRAQVGVDSTLPVVGLVCGPGNNSVATVANDTLCFTCGVNGSEPLGCSRIVVSVNGGPEVDALLANGSTAANFSVCGNPWVPHYCV